MKMFECFTTCQPYLTHRAALERDLREETVIRNAELVCEAADCKRMVVSLPFDEKAKDELQRSLDDLALSLESIDDSLIDLRLAHEDLGAVVCPGPDPLSLSIGRHACQHPTFHEEVK